MTIKQIAAMAGVSAGTVDRILHNRGNVSERKQRAVENVLRDVGYRSNIHTSAVSLKKSWRIAVTTPVRKAGEYWDLLLQGVRRALEEYSDIRIVEEDFPYDQFDVFDCQEVYARIPEAKPDGVIIGPIFQKETETLCAALDRNGIPYVFVDAAIEGTHPVAIFRTDQAMCGALVGRLLTGITAPDAPIAVFGIDRRGNEHAFNSRLREAGLAQWLAQRGQEDRLIRTSISFQDEALRDRQIEDFFRKHPGTLGGVVMNSRGGLVADSIRRLGLRDISLISFDLTEDNRRCLEEGSITALLCQRPAYQGFSAIKGLISHLLYRKGLKEETVPCDIVLKENLPLYREILDD